MKNNNSVINTNWNLTSSLSSSFQNRDTVKYSYLSNEGNDDIVSVTATTYTTGTNLKIEMKVSNDEIDAKKLKELIESAKAEQQNTESNSLNKIENELYYSKNKLHGLISNVYIENALGEKFYVTAKVTTDEYITNSQVKDYIIYSNTFDMTTYNYTNMIILHFTYNFKDYVLNLECLT